MNSLDWIVLVTSLVGIVLYGIWKGKDTNNIEGYLLAGKTMPWYSVGLSIMATQASAITFLSAPGQAYADGMRFVQFYFGLPIAMVVLSVTAVPIYHRLKVYTAYEYLEGRFDLKTRALAAFLFLTQRGLATGLTIYAPSIILSAILGWNIYLTNLVIGTLVIIYTVAGGSKGGHHLGWHGDGLFHAGLLASFRHFVRRCRAGSGQDGQTQRHRLFFRLEQPVYPLVGPDRGIFPGDVVLRHRSVAGGALPGRQLDF
jgi:solute:Na+ symporter, SSS family